MDKSERETRDFMNVDSFSQLPFIRPAPKEKPPASSSASGIKLFGIEFDPADDPSSESKPNDPDTFKSTTSADSNANVNSNSESSRRFECHYCCRNFPTSQALGGHQNAHKRERQHAKRAHLQSAIAAHSGLPDIYGFGAYETSPVAYTSHTHWGYGSGRYYGGGSSNNTNDRINNNYYNGDTFGLHNYTHQQPINGNPLWRIPAVAAAHATSREQIPMLGRDIADTSGQHGRVEGVYAYDAKAGMQDNIELSQKDMKHPPARTKPTPVSFMTWFIHGINRKKPYWITKSTEMKADGTFTNPQPPDTGSGETLTYLVQ